MHGGMKVYAGSPAAARHYVEVGRARADDYYLAEGTGIARRFTATDGHVSELAPLTGDAYETWVAGRDPATGEPRGRLREDACAVRFVEVVVNGPKSWSLAAALHPDVAAAYEGAQDRAVQQILSWVSQHATTRVGPRGGQVPVPLGVLEAATVAHYTSRASDPHWHLHLQINSRVYAAGKWRGLFTVDIRDSLGAINGIGHAAMATDPQLNAVLAAHGYSKDATGEIRQLAEFVGPFSARHQQIARNVNRYEREWTTAHPGERAGPTLRRAWDARAWAEHRPDKILPLPGADVRGRWQAMLADCGYRAPDRPVDQAPTPVGALDRDELAERALSRLAASRSAWNPADVRGEVERLIAESGVVTAAAVRIELAEDLTARALDRCVLLLDRDGVPEHIRAWSAPAVLEVEADLIGRLAVRAALDSGGAPNDSPTPRPEGVTPFADEQVTPVGVGVTPLAEWVTPPSQAPRGRLDAGQAAAAAVLAGDRHLVVVEGAAGAGKTTTLAATRDLLAGQGRRLVVVTPTLKAAQAASREVGAAAGSAAGLAFHHGWRWDDDGAWTRLSAGEPDPAGGRFFAGPTEAARLRAGDLLVIDEAGMLDQDTARALLTIADEAQARVALLGDRHQLPAVGRGGVLDLAIHEVNPTGHLTLDDVHRFIRPDETGQEVPDREYAELTLAMRAGTDPGAVFDALAARGQIRLHYGEEERQDAIAETTAENYEAGQRVAVVVDTREQATDFNEVIRGYLAYRGQVDDTPAATIRAGQQAGPGDLIATRRNDRALGVANRDTWTVVAVHPDGSLTVTPTAGGTGDASAGVTPGVHRGVTPGAAGVRVLPPAYVRERVELAYASTVHGVQGDTVSAAHLVVGEHTRAASAYVGMTRGRTANTAHLIAGDLAEAREAWVAVFARDHADLGPAHAGALAAIEAAHRATPRPVNQALAELHQAWSVEQDRTETLGWAEPRRDLLLELVALQPELDQRRAPRNAAYDAARDAADRTRARAGASEDAISLDADRIRASLLHAWEDELAAVDRAAAVLREGPGRLGLHLRAVRSAGDQLGAWAEEWRPLLPDLSTDPQELAHFVYSYGLFGHRTREQLAAVAQVRARDAHPEHAANLAAAAAARAALDQARSTYLAPDPDRQRHLQHFGAVAQLSDPNRALAGTEDLVAAARLDLDDARARITRITAEPAIGALPPGRLDHERDTWQAQRQADRAQAAAGRAQREAREAAERAVSRPPAAYQQLYGHDPGYPRGGPSIGR